MVVKYISEMLSSVFCCQKKRTRNKLNAAALADFAEKEEIVEKTEKCERLETTTGDSRKEKRSAKEKGRKEEKSKSKRDRDKEKKSRKSGLDKFSKRLNDNEDTGIQGETLLAEKKSRDRKSGKEKTKKTKSKKKEKRTTDDDISLAELTRDASVEESSDKDTGKGFKRAAEKLAKRKRRQKREADSSDKSAPGRSLRASKVKRKSENERIRRSKKDGRSKTAEDDYHGYGVEEDEETEVTCMIDFYDKVHFNRVLAKKMANFLGDSGKKSKGKNGKEKDNS